MYLEWNLSNEVIKHIINSDKNDDLLRINKVSIK